ncbi:hypothetical protein POF45_29735, partial [Pseudomonas sp. 681]
CIIEDTVYGELDSGEAVSIHKAMYHQKAFGVGEIPPSTLSSPILFIGNTYLKSKESIKGTNFEFEIKGLAPWFEDASSLEGSYETTLMFSGFKINLRYSPAKENSPTKSTIISPRPATIEQFQTVLHRAVTFISFATGKILLQGKTEITDGQEKWCLYYKPAFFSSRIEEENPPLFGSTLAQLQHRFNSWNKLYNKILPLIILYFLPKISESDLNTKYLLRAQLIEALHKKLENNNEMDYFERVREVVSRQKYKALLFRVKSEEAQVIEGLCRDITRSRNYFTHYSREQPPAAANAENLPFLYSKIDIIIDLFLLDKLGFDGAHFKKIQTDSISDRFERKKKLEQFLNNRRYY